MYFEKFSEDGELPQNYFALFLPQNTSFMSISGMIQDDEVEMKIDNISEILDCFHCGMELQSKISGLENDDDCLDN